MAAKLLLPGYGGAYTSEVFDANSTIGADTIDVSLCTQFVVQVNSNGTAGSPTGNIDMEQRVNGSDWAAFPAPGANMAITDGSMILFDESDGPFGLMRINATDITDGGIDVTIVGFKK